MFNLIVHQTGKASVGLLNVNLGAAVRLNDISKALGNCSVPAVNTAAVLAPVAMVLMDTNGFATYLSRCAFVGAGSVWEHESAGYGHAKQRSSASGLRCWVMGAGHWCG